MATDSLYEIAKDPEVFLLLFKLYQSGLLTQTQNVKQQSELSKKQENLQESIDEVIETIHKEELKVDFPTTLAPTQEDDIELIQIINSEECMYKNLLDNLIVHLGKRKVLPDEEFCKLFEGGEHGLFFQSLKQSYSLKELLHFLHDCVVPHHAFSLLKKFPISISANQLIDLAVQEKDMKAVQRVTGLAISSILNLKSVNNYPHLFGVFESLMLTLELKHNTFIAYNFKSVSKMSLKYPLFNISETFKVMIETWPNLEEIECECYKLVIGKGEKKNQIIEITIRDHVHTAVVQNLLASFPNIFQLNVNLKFWLEYKNSINKAITMGVLIPIGQTRLFTLLFNDHRVGSYPFYTIEDPLVLVADFRKAYCEELGLIGLVSTLHQNAQTLREIANETLCGDDIIKVKNIVKKIDRLVDRMDEEESVDFVVSFEECILQFETVKKQTIDRL